MAPESILVSLGGEKLRFRVDGDDGLAGLMSALHGRRRAFPGRPDFELRWKGERGLLLQRGRIRHRSDSRHDLVLDAEWRATNEAMARLQRKVLILHAAWTARGRRGVLIAGPHGRGKTTLATALALRHGWRLLSDDLTLVSRSGTVRPFERPVRLKPGIRRMLPELRALGLDLSPWRRGWTALAPLALFTGRGPATLQVIVLLGARKTGALRMKRVEAGVAVAALARLAFNFADNPAAALKSLATLTAGAAIYELSGGTIRERCAALARIL